jgi:manganese/zinc/iron transport system permease protein
MISPDTFWILLIGSLVATSCAVVGCFLVLRRLSMLGDAISHAVLPGIVIAFMLTGSRNIGFMLVGAMAMGMLTAFLTDVLNRFGKLQSDAAMGVTFTWLFAIGVILVSKYTGSVDLDVDCVLYGEIVLAPLDTLEIGGREFGPRAAWLTGFVCLANIIFVTLGYKQLKVCAFDAGMAASIGLSVALWHYLLMGFVSLTTVASFESVGAILVVAMLIVPPNTAYLLTDRLSHMLYISVAVGILSALGGFLLASWLDGAIAAAMAVVSGGLYALTALFAPRHGVLFKYLAHRNLRTSTADIAEPELP